MAKDDEEPKKVSLNYKQKKAKPYDIKTIEAWQSLIPALMKDYWDKEEACMIFNGYIWVGAKGRLTQIETGQEITAFSGDTRSEMYSETINDKYLQICDIWNNTEHCYMSGIWKQMQSWNKYYCIHWASTKSRFIQMPWVQWAYDEGLLDMEEHRQMLQIMNNKVVPLKTKAAAKAESQVVNAREEKSSLRIIGAMRDILRKQDGPKSFSSNDQLVNYILEKYQGEGLSRNTLKERFKDGKNITAHRNNEPTKK